MKKAAIALGALTALTLIAGPAAAGSGPKKAWVCHFEDNHHQNADGSVFFTTPGNQQLDGQPEALTGDYVLPYESGGNPSFCNSFGGEVLLVSVNALGSDEDATGHRVQLLDRLGPVGTYTAGYPDGFKG